MEQIKYDVFISYSHKDYVDEKGDVIPNNEVSKIIDALTKAEISFWFDQEGIKRGEDFGAKILKYIKASKVFVFLSTAAANNSVWTRKEIACAWECKKKIIPVRIDDSPYHDSVMFRIADLDYIKYGSNPKKGREALVDSIKFFMAEEKAAAARREAEEQLRREEQERQYRQQEELRRKQQQADNLRAEINKTEEECTALEKTLLQKQHDLSEVEHELKIKHQHLEEQKRQINSIIYEGNTTSEPPSFGPSFAQKEYESFIFCWRHPLNSFREMWLKLKNTFAQRHWTVSLILWLYIAVSIIGSMAFFEEYGTRDASWCVVAILTFYALFQLILNKRSAIGFMLLTPIMTLLISYFYSNDLYRRLTYRWDVVYFWGPFILSCLPLILVFPILLIHKGGKSAWSLLEGKVNQAFHISKSASYYFIICLLLLFSISYFENGIVETANSLQEEKHDSKELATERDSLIAERDSLIAERDILVNSLDAYDAYMVGRQAFDSGTHKKAVEFYLLALNKGLIRDYSKYAQYHLGICYEKGLGVEPDTTKAITWYEKAYEGSNYVPEAGTAYRRLLEKRKKK